MNEDDQAYLKSFNKKRKDPLSQCSDLEFEQVMHGLEEATAERQPYAAIDASPVPNFDELEDALDEWIEEDRTRKFAREIYQHWKARRSNAGNKPLTVALKVGRLLTRSIDDN